jgi:O-antigen/teichoic acid export membrane protein
MGKSLASKIKWTSINSVGGALIGPIVIITQARYLSLEEMGTVALLMISFEFLSIFLTHGIAQSIVKFNVVDSVTLSSLMSAALFFGLLVGCILFVSSSYVEGYFRILGYANYQILLAIQLAIVSFGSIFKGALLQRQDFKQLAIFELSATISLVLVQVAFFQLDFGIASVLIAGIVSATLKSIMMKRWYSRSGLPQVRLTFDLSSIRNHLRFGWFYSAKMGVNFINHNVDSLIIGAVLSPNVLGPYYLAKRNLDRLRIVVSNALTGFLFPHLNQFASQPEELKRLYEKTFKIMFMVAILLSSIIASTATWFVPVLFGSSWLDSIPIFQWLAFSLLTSLVTSNIATSILYVLNKEQVLFRTELLFGLTYISALFLVSKFGLVAILGTYLAYSTVMPLYLHYLATKELRMPVKTLGMASIRFLLIWFCVIVLMHILGNSLDGLAPDFLMLVLASITTAALIVFGIRIVDIQTWHSLMSHFVNKPVQR